MVEFTKTLSIPLSRIKERIAPTEFLTKVCLVGIMRKNTIELNRKRGKGKRNQPTRGQYFTKVENIFSLFKICFQLYLPVVLIGIWLDNSKHKIHAWSVTTMRSFYAQSRYLRILYVGSRNISGTKQCRRQKNIRKVIRILLLLE